jgi:hypothetical protein
MGCHMRKKLHAGLLTLLGPLHLDYLKTCEKDPLEGKFDLHLIPKHLGEPPGLLQTFCGGPGDATAGSSAVAQIQKLISLCD